MPGSSTPNYRRLLELDFKKKLMFGQRKVGDSSLFLAKLVVSDLYYLHLNAHPLQLPTTTLMLLQWQGTLQCSFSLCQLLLAARPTPGIGPK